jgi:uncharacterized protein YutE (UPF0331/DUF86 family)
VDRLLIDQKLETLRHCLVRMAGKCPPDATTLAEDIDLQDILVLNLTRSVQLCVDIASHIIAASSEAAPASMGEAFATLARMGVIDDTTATNLRRAVGFRNIAVHNYDKVDWNIVHAICVRQLDDFRAFASKIGTFLAEP